jgi:hypothetical protein
MTRKVKAAKRSEGGRAVLAGRRIGSEGSAHTPFACRLCRGAGRFGRAVALPWLAAALLGASMWWGWERPVEPVARWVGSLGVVVWMLAGLFGTPLLVAAGIFRVIETRAEDRR